MHVPPVTAIRAALDARLADRGAVASTAQGERLVHDVDFPQFVADLMDGVFGAVLDASLRQMDAYTDLVAKADQTGRSLVATSPEPCHALHALLED